jgi:phage-related protein
MTYFTYNGRSSEEFGLHIQKKDVFSAPEYDAEFTSIPGRSGDLIVSGRRFSKCARHALLLGGESPPQTWQ